MTSIGSIRWVQMSRQSHHLQYQYLSILYIYICIYICIIQIFVFHTIVAMMCIYIIYVYTTYITKIFTCIYIYIIYIIYIYIYLHHFLNHFNTLMLDASKFSKWSCSIPSLDSSVQLRALSMPDTVITSRPGDRTCSTPMGAIHRGATVPAEATER